MTTKSRANSPYQSWGSSLLHLSIDPTILWSCRSRERLAAESLFNLFSLSVSRLLLRRQSVFLCIIIKPRNLELILFITKSLTGGATIYTRDASASPS